MQSTKNYELDDVLMEFVRNSVTNFDNKSEALESLKLYIQDIVKLLDCQLDLLQRASNGDNVFTKKEIHNAIRETGIDLESTELQDLINYWSQYLRDDDECLRRHTTYQHDEKFYVVAQLETVILHAALNYLFASTREILKTL